MALTRESLEAYAKSLPEDCLIMADASLPVPPEIEGRNVILAPILETAKEKVGKAVVANIVAVGAINEALGLVPFEALEKAVKMHIPKGTEELNGRALLEGVKMKQVKKGRSKK